MQPSDELQELRSNIRKYEKLLDEATGPATTQTLLLENLLLMRKKEAMLMERE